MKKLIATLFLVLICVLTLFTFTGCDTADIDIRVENGVAYFFCSQITPEIILVGEEDKRVEDEYFFGNLMDAIDGKQVISDICNCEALYTVKIKEYRFGLHTHGISIFKYSNNNQKYITHIGMVECDEETMAELFSPLEAVQ